MYRKILVPLDGSTFGEQALPVALGIARHAGAVLCLAHVYAGEWPAAANMPTLPGAEEDRQAQPSERAYLDRLTRHIAAAGDGLIETVLLDGPVAETLGAYARAAGAELIVMSTHGRGALGRVWLGSVAAELACRSPVPLLLVRPVGEPGPIAEAPPVRHVLIPLDGSPFAEQAVAPALKLGKLTGAEYTLLQVLDPLLVEHTRPPYSAGLERLRLPEIWNGAEEYLKRVSAHLFRDALRVRTSVGVGQPAQAIRAFAQTHDVDLIAMATHGYSGAVRYVLGSVADAVVHRADVPVLLVRPSAAA